MRVVTNQRITEEVLSLDDTHLVDCLIENCVLVYTGKPVILEQSQFIGCSFRFGGEAAMTLRFVQAMQIPLNDDLTYPTDLLSTVPN